MFAKTTLKRMNRTMISTPKRESVTIDVDPRVTFKASGEAVSRGLTTTEVLREWLDKAAGIQEELNVPSTEKGAHQ